MSVELNPFELHLLFQRIEPVVLSGKRALYEFKDQHDNYAGQIFFSENQWSFEIDNFPGQKRYYRTDFPIRTADEFIHEMKRIDLSFQLLTF